MEQPPLYRTERNGSSRSRWKRQERESFNGQSQKLRAIDDPKHICEYYDRASYDINDDDPSISDMSQQELIRHDIRRQRRQKRRNRPGLKLFPKLRQFVSPKHMSLKQFSDETSSTANTTHDGNHEEENTILRVRQLSTTLPQDTPATSLLQLQVAPHRPRRAMPPPPSPPPVAVKSLPPKPFPRRPPTQRRTAPQPPTPPRVRFLPDDQSSVPWDERLDEIKSILKPSTFGHPAEKHTTPVRIHHTVTARSHDKHHVLKEHEPHGDFRMEDSFLESVAAIVIQTCIRRFLAVRTVVRMILSEEQDDPTVYPKGELPHDDKDDDFMEFFHLAARIIQMAWCRYVYTKTAATNIQRVFRGYWARDCLSIDHYCATTLQALGRGYLVRLMMKMQAKPKVSGRRRVRDMWTERAKRNPPLSPILPY